MPEVLDRIAVTVDKHVIAESDVIRYLRVAAFLDHKPVDLSGASRRAAAAALVDRDLILEESEDSHFTLPSTDDDAALLQQVKAQYPSEAAYQAALAGISDQRTGFGEPSPGGRARSALHRSALPPGSPDLRSGDERGI